MKRSFTLCKCQHSHAASFPLYPSTQTSLLTHMLSKSIEFPTQAVIPHPTLLHAASGACATSGSSIHDLGQGETLPSIAATCSISPEALSTINPHVPDQGSAYPGLPICVPPACCHSLPCSQAAAPAPAPAPALYSNGISAGILYILRILSTPFHTVAHA